MAGDDHELARGNIQAHVNQGIATRARKRNPGLRPQSSYCTWIAVTRGATPRRSCAPGESHVRSGLADDGNSADPRPPALANGSDTGSLRDRTHLGLGRGCISPVPCQRHTLVLCAPSPRPGACYPCRTASRPDHTWLLLQAPLTSTVAAPMTTSSLTPVPGLEFRARQVVRVSLPPLRGKQQPGLSCTSSRLIKKAYPSEPAPGAATPRPEAGRGY